MSQFLLKFCSPGGQAGAPTYTGLASGRSCGVRAARRD